MNSSLLISYLFLHTYLNKYDLYYYLFFQYDSIRSKNKDITEYSIWSIPFYFL
uniref:Uncharacterized protein n=1 Tax=Myoviridae sp. ctcyQ27 TaxID=2825139 RepID=A0A8S5UF74_9CAUD|nr:MAG TPA: hypothetical protein [Myoviridae sp. ctcyQ27]